MAAMQDPKMREMVGQSPFAQAIGQAMAAHITEHVAFQYRREIEKMLGVEMPNEDQPLPEDVEIQLSRLAKDAAEKLLQKDQTEAQQKQMEQQQQDPVVQMQQAELQIKQKELQHKIQMDTAKLQIDAERISAENQREGARLGVRLATDLDKSQREDQKEGAKLGMEIAKELAKGDGR
jgi:TPP-dependent 2-oxoacid decarboxylase